MQATHASGHVGWLYDLAKDPCLPVHAFIFFTSFLIFHSYLRACLVGPLWCVWWEMEIVCGCALKMHVHECVPAWVACLCCLCCAASDIESTLFVQMLGFGIVILIWVLGKACAWRTSGCLWAYEYRRVKMPHDSSFLTEAEIWNCRSDDGDWQPDFSGGEVKHLWLCSSSSPSLFLPPPLAVLRTWRL